jgi:hypothetical protein
MRAITVASAPHPACAPASGQPRVDIVRHRIRSARVDPAEVRNVAPDAHAEFRQEAAADRRGSNASRGFPRGGALEDVARVVTIILEEAGQVRVTRPHPRHRAAPWIGVAFAGAGSMTSCQFFQSRFRMSIEMANRLSGRRALRR